MKHQYDFKDNTIKEIATVVSLSNEVNVLLTYEQI